MQFGAARARKSPERDVADFTPAGRPVVDPHVSLAAFKRAIAEKVQSWTPANQYTVLAELTQTLDLFLQNSEIHGAGAKKQFLLQQIQKIAGPRGQGNLAIAQMNFTVGDLLGNARKVMTYMDAAEKAGVDTVVFPEQPLTGWPLGDLVAFYPQLVEDQMKVLHALAAKTQKTRVMLGFVEPRYPGPGEEPAQGRRFFNSVAILGNGQIEGIVRKSALPTYGEFYEGRQLEPSPSVGMHPPESLRDATWGQAEMSRAGELSEIHGTRYAVSICEDIWADGGLGGSALYKRNPIEALMSLKPQVLVNVSASPSRAHKEAQKHAMLGKTAAKWQVPLVYVNAVGGNDELVYDGASRVYDAQGQLVARAKAFEEQFLIVNPNRGEGVLFPLPGGRALPTAVSKSRRFDAEEKADLPRTYLGARLALQDYWRKNGYSKAVLGISGGIDSAVAAALAVDALGVKNVLGVFMPSEGITQDESRRDAEGLCRNLGIPLMTMPIGGVLDAVQQVLNPAFEQISKTWGLPACNPQTHQNNQSRIRSLFLRAITNQFGKVLMIGTSDKSESVIGNGTVAGDMSSDYAVLKDITKLKLNALARWINRQPETKGWIPRNIITKPPTAELDLKAGTEAVLSDDERYGSTFLLRDEATHKLLRGTSLAQMLEQNFEAQQAEGLSEEEKALGLERFFYHLAKNGIFKWGHLAKGPILDEKGMTPGELQIPIVAGWNVPWGGLGEQEIQQALNVENPFSSPTFPERVTQRLQALGILPVDPHQ